MRVRKISLSEVFHHLFHLFPHFELQVSHHMMQLSPRSPVLNPRPPIHFNIWFAFAFVSKIWRLRLALWARLSRQVDREMVKSLFELVCRIWCAVRSIICYVFDLTCCLDCRSKIFLRVPSLCSVCMCHKHTHWHTLTNSMAGKFDTFIHLWPSVFTH